MSNNGSGFSNVLQPASLAAVASVATSVASIAISVSYDTTAARISGWHHHPYSTASAPDMVSRRAAANITNIVTGNIFVLDGVTYTFVAALGSPAASHVQIVTQGALTTNVQLLAASTRGLPSTEVAYGAGTNPNPTSLAYWTSQRFAVGATTIPAGENLFILERGEDSIAALTLSTTTTATLTQFTRAAFSRYVLNGNANPATNSIRGSMHCVLPVNSILQGGQANPDVQVYYDVHEIVLTDQSDTSEKEIDLYISPDEVTFSRICRSIPVGDPSTATAIHHHIPIMARRVPPGYGYYIRVGSNGTSATANLDFKFNYHIYPEGV